MRNMSNAWHVWCLARQLPAISTSAAVKDPTSGLLDRAASMQDGQVEPEYCASALADTLGERASVADPCTVLYHHLNHRRNRAIVAPLLQAAHSVGPPAARLLKLLCHALYTPELVRDDAAMIARGAFAYVQQRTLALAADAGAPPVPVAEKVRRAPM
jgi:hypothetical protein